MSDSGKILRLSNPTPPGVETMKNKYVVIFAVSLLIVVAFSLPCEAQTSNVVIACVQKETGLTRIVSNPNECGSDETGALRDAVDLQGAVRSGARGIQASNPPVALKIGRVIPDQQVLKIEGINFGSTPTVLLAAGGGGVVPLTVTGANNEVITATLGTVLPGTYLLIVVNGNGNLQQDTMAVTLGAVGAKGDKGEPGLDGHTPVLTWLEDRIAVDGTATGPHLTGPQGLKGDKGDTGTAGHAPVLAWLEDQIAVDGTVTGPHLTGSQGPKGDKGDTGEAGHSPVLTWLGDRIAIDGAVTGPSLTGPQGPAGTVPTEVISAVCDLTKSTPNAPCPSFCQCPEEGVKLVFVTSKGYDWNFNGIQRADDQCQLLALSAGLRGNFKAWLSEDPSNSPANRFAHSTYPYKRVDGVLVADNWDDLTDGGLINPINVTEKGVSIGEEQVWTNTKSDGLGVSNLPCNDWGNLCASFGRCLESEGGAVVRGNTNKVDTSWSNSPNVWVCSIGSRLYCFQQ